MPRRHFIAPPYSNDPPYLFHIANHCSDVPSVFAFLKEVEEERHKLEEEWRREVQS